MMNKKILTTLLTIIVISIFFISPTTAADEDLTFQQWETVNLKLPCTYNGANCDVTAECNLSVTFPNGSFLTENKPMTNNGNGMPNYTLTAMSTLGVHNYKQTCLQAGLSASDSGVITITSTGSESSIKLPLFLGIFALILLVLGITLENPMMGFFSGILFLMIGMYLMIYGFGDINDLYTQAFALIIIAMGMVITIMAGFSWMDDY